MDFWALILLAVGLSLDALAVSVATACGAGRMPRRDVLKLAGAFGLFQAVMPLAGWALGQSVRRQIEAFDHWLAFGLLLFIGGKMVVESFRARREECVARRLTLPLLLTLAVATSIDALAAGLGLAFLDVPILFPALFIGGVTFALSATGALLAMQLERWLRGNAELAGGLALVGIGAKILVDHLA